MSINREPEIRDEDENVSPQDILAVMSGVATKTTAQRVWSRCVSDNKTRYQVAWSLPPDDEEDQIQDAISDAPKDIPESLKQRTRMLTDRFISVQQPRLAERVLSVLETLLNLPCFSPALAASDASLSPKIVSQTVVTTEGIRIELQQLPTVAVDTETAPTLRIIVDASVFSGNDLLYTQCTLTVTDGDDALVLFAVPLNVQGRGLLDVRNLPAAKSACRLAEVRLSCD